MRISSITKNTYLFKLLLRKQHLAGAHQFWMKILLQLECGEYSLLRWIATVVSHSLTYVTDHTTFQTSVLNINTI